MNRVKQLRSEKSMSQIRLSIELGVAQETVSAYENGKYYPSFEMLCKMSKIFEVNIDYLMGLSDVRKPISHGELAPEEIEHLIKYRKLSKKHKEKATGFILGLMENV